MYTNMCVVWKNGIDHLIWKAEIDTGLENGCMDPKGEREGWEEMEPRERPWVGAN